MKQVQVPSSVSMYGMFRGNEQHTFVPPLEVFYHMQQLLPCYVQGIP